MSMFMASMRRAYEAGELKGDGMTSAWLRSAVEEDLAESRDGGEAVHSPADGEGSREEPKDRLQAIAASGEDKTNAG